jgi:hypothetical protein
VSILGLLEAFKKLDSDTVTVLTRFVMRGVKSGNLNGYVKGHLQRVLDVEDAEAIRDRGPQVTTRVVPNKG